MNGTKIRQRLAFQYGIYAVKRGIYPFVTPESGRSDMRARVEARCDAERREVEYQHVAGIFSTITHMWEGKKHEIREALMADLDTDWILSDTVFT